MIPTLCLISVALAPAQPAGVSDWLLTPRWGRGQELVYQGSYLEESLGKGIQFTRSYHLHHRVFVLDKNPQGMELALLTTLKQQPPRHNRPAGKDDALPDPGTVRLELARLSADGKLSTMSGASVLMPLQGPATVEAGELVEPPNRRLRPGQTWVVTEDGRPPRTWTLAGVEAMNGTSCVKLTAVQQSEDWDRPRGDRTAWRRQDIVWLAPRQGIAKRVERTIEQREPARTEPTSRAVTRYDLESTVVYPGQLFEDRYREITQAKSFAESAEPILREPGKHGPKPVDALLTKMRYHVDNRAPTPYREAVVHLQQRVEFARNAPTVPVKLADSGWPGAVASVGQPAPDFVVAGVSPARPVHLHRLLGKPILLVFYNPTSQTAAELLRFAQSLQDKSAALTVLGMAVSDDTEGILRQHKALELQIPLVSGKGLRQSYGVDATPKLVLLDGDGYVRGTYEGWGREIPQAVTQELERWAKK